MSNCISCGEEATHFEQKGNVKIVIHKECIEEREPEDQEKVIFKEEKKTPLEKVVESVKSCEDCKANDPREAEAGELCPECAADWNFYLENQKDVEKSHKTPKEVEA